MSSEIVMTVGRWLTWLLVMFVAGLLVGLAVAS